MIVVIAHDRPDSAHIRAENRVAHVAGLRALSEQGLIQFAGPLLDDQGEQMQGSLLIFNTDDLELVRSTIDQDPYVQAGLFEPDMIITRRVKKVLPA